MKAGIRHMDVAEVRKQFPVLNQQVNKKPLVYFDNAATTQKPLSVIEAMDHYYRNNNANIHRGVHTLAERATAGFEATRKRLQGFIHASEAAEIIFTKGTTEGINLVAQGLSYGKIVEGDEIIISSLEHHSNIVPWQMLCERTGAKLKVIPLRDDGRIDMKAYEDLLSPKTAMVAVNHVSNALGTINPVQEIIQMARSAGAWTLIDGAQAASHIEIDVQSLDCDFYAFSAHKMYGPTGLGALYGKRALLEELPPYQFGGEMIRNVSFEKTTFNDLPYKFEAGTPNIADVNAWIKAIDFVDDLGKPAIREHEHSLTTYALENWKHLKGITLYGPEERMSVVSFNIDGIHGFDIGQMLDARGVAVRTGHHCAEPLMGLLGVDGTVRASFAVYNTKEEVDQMTEGLERIVKFFSK